MNIREFSIGCVVEGLQLVRGNSRCNDETQVCCFLEVVFDIYETKNTQFKLPFRTILSQKF